MKPKKNDNKVINLDFDTLTSIILFSQKNNKVIKREFNKLKKFYITHPEAFYYYLERSKENIETKPELDSTDSAMLDEINNFLYNENDINKSFKFKNIFLLDDYKKIYEQIERYSINLIRNNSSVNILFYALDDSKRKKINIGGVYADGTVNTGSKFILKLIKLNSLDFLTTYQMLCN